MAESGKDGPKSPKASSTADLSLALVPATLPPLDTLYLTQELAAARKGLLLPATPALFLSHLQALATASIVTRSHALVLATGQLLGEEERGGEEGRGGEGRGEEESRG